MQSQEGPGSASGQATVDFYIATARRMRAEWFARQLAAIRQRLAALLCKPVFGCAGAAVNH